MGSTRLSHNPHSSINFIFLSLLSLSFHLYILVYIAKLKSDQRMINTILFVGDTCLILNIADISDSCPSDSQTVLSIRLSCD